MSTLRNTISSRKLTGASSDTSSRFNENGSTVSSSTTDKSIAILYGCHAPMAMPHAKNWPPSAFFGNPSPLVEQP
jgi:hypothetical protein